MGYRMADPSPLVRALFDLRVYDEVSLTLEDASQLEATVTVVPSYNPFDPTGQPAQGSLRVRCTLTRAAYDRLDPPSARLMIDAIERRVWEQPSVSVYDPETESVGDGATRIVRNRWSSLGTLIGIEDRALNGEG